MALIKCANCGKNVSDTLTNCYFCNAKLKEDLLQNTYENLENLTIYNDLLSKEKESIQKEFIKGNQYAYLYFRKLTSLKGYGKIFFTTYMFLMLTMFIVVVFTGEGISFYYNNIKNETLIFVSLSLVLLAFFLSFIYLVVATIILLLIKKSNRRYFIIKLYQKWLLKKGYFYEPEFKNEKLKEIFDNIQIENDYLEGENYGVN